MLLILLVSRNGDLVTREEIVEKLWGKDVFIETEHGINTAVRKLRQALGDDPEYPRFVKTLVGRGYRFSATITSPPEQTEALPLKDQENVPAAVSGFLKHKRWFWRAAIALVLVLGLLLAANVAGFRDRLTSKNTQIHRTP